MFQRKTMAYPWQCEIKPFKIIGNTYFVGTYPSSVHLISTEEGLILIDTGHANLLYLVIHSIYSLGFDVKDIKYIIHSHWHIDHTEATRDLAKLCDAKTFIGAKDAEKARQFFEPDVLLYDGDTVELGGVKIRCIDTPGHTEGCMSFFYETEENGKIYKVGTFGGAGANSLKKGEFEYDECREDYFASLKRLKGEEVDVFIGNHVWNNDTVTKAQILEATEENKFIDGKIWIDFLEFCEDRLRKIIESEKTV